MIPMKHLVVAGIGIALGSFLVLFPPVPSGAGEMGRMPIGKMVPSRMEHTRAVFRVTGMECRQCIRKISLALMNLPGGGFSRKERSGGRL